MRCNDSHSAKHAWQFGPCLDACLSHLAHPVVKLLLISAISLDLASANSDFNSRTQAEQKCQSIFTSSCGLTK